MPSGKRSAGDNCGMMRYVLIVWHVLCAGLSTECLAIDPVRDRLDRAAVFAWIDMEGREGLQKCRRLHAGYVYRGWFNWAGQYPYLQRWVVPAAREMGAVFCGGVTVPAYYPHQRVPEHFRDWPGRRDESATCPAEWVTCSPGGVPNKIANAYYHGSIYHPRYRDFILANAQEQIDLGVEAIAFDEICGALGPIAGGYDPACLDRFKQYLRRKYADLTPAEWKARFDIADPATFDYRQYLADHGWLDDPETAANPLVWEYGHYNPWLEGRCNQHPYHEEGSFRRQAWLEFWQWLVNATRRYAREAGREVLVSANGLAPFTDMQEFALLFARPGTLKEHLDGSISVLDRWHSFVVDSQERYGLEVPVMGHHDWHDPATNPDIYDLPGPEQKVYLRLYSAEAYAAGGFYCFNQGGGGSGYSPDPATYATMDQLAGFYQQYASFYARCFPKAPFRGTVTTNTPHLAVKAWSQPGLRRILVHLINHVWDPVQHDIVPQRDVVVTVRGVLPGPGPRAWVVSPDFPEARPVEVKASPDTYTVEVTVPGLRYYDVVVMERQPSGAALGELVGTVTESHGRPVAGATVSLWGTKRRVRTDSRGRYRFPRVPADGPTAGFYEVNAESPDYWPGRAPGVQIRGGGIVHHDLRISHRGLLEDFEQGVGAWFQMARPARPWAMGLRPIASTRPEGGQRAAVVSFSSAGGDGFQGDHAQEEWDRPVKEIVRGVSGELGAGAEGIRFWARSLTGRVRVQIVLREYDLVWDLNDSPKSASHAAEISIDPGRWQQYVVPFSCLHPLDGVPLNLKRVRLLLFRALDPQPARVALDEIEVFRTAREDH